MDHVMASSFAEVLKELRKRKGVKQQKLAEKLGVHVNTISGWECGNNLPASRGMIIELAYQLHLDEQETRLLLETSLMKISAHWNVPYQRNTFFTGREEILKYIHLFLRSEESAVPGQSYALTGLGGIGKTQTAVEYAYRYALEYMGVFWICADTYDTIISSFVSIANLLNIAEKQEQDQKKIVAAVRHWFNSHQDWLLIVDNVEDVGLVKDVLPTSRSGSILLTTGMQTMGPLAQSVDLLQMASDEGVLFLLRRAKLLGLQGSMEHVSPDDIITATRIVEALGGLPLAIDQAGAYIEESGCRLANYFEHYQCRRAELLDLRSLQKGNSLDHPLSVSATLAVTIKRMEQEDPAALNLLRLSAFLHPDAIPEEFFTQNVECTGSVRSPGEDLYRFDRAIATLRTTSLMGRHAGTKTVMVHRLVQAILLDNMTEEQQRQWAQRAICRVNAIFPQEGEASLWPQSQRCLAHADVCIKYINQLGIVALEAGQLLFRVGSYLWERGHYLQAESALCQSRDIRMQLFGPGHLDVAESLNNLANLYADQGKFGEAEILLQQSLSIREQQLGPSHIDVAETLNNLATLYDDQKRFLEAELLFLRVRVICEKISGLEHPNTATSIGHIANVYRKQGKLTEAEALFQQALAIRQKVLEPNDPDIARSLNGLAALYSDQRKFTEAESLFQQALAIREEALGPDHPHTARSCEGLASLYREQGRCVEAQAFYQRVLAIREKVLGAEHPLTIKAQQDYCSLLQLLERKDGERAL